MDINGWQYEVELVMVSDQAKKAIFKVNGEKSDILSEGESTKFSDGTSLLAREILIQEGGDGSDIVQYNIYAGKKQPTYVSTPQQEEVTVQPTQEYEPQEPAIQEAPPQQQQTGQKEAKVDMTRVQVKKKSWLI